MALQDFGWAAGLEHGWIRTSDGEYHDIEAVVSFEGDPQQDEIEIKGDDELKATFVSNITEEVTIKANGVNFDTVQAMTGNSMASSPEGLEIPLGTDSQKNPPFVEVGGNAQAKNGDGTLATLQKILHKVQIYSIKLSMAGEAESNIELKGKAYKTALDIVGGALSPSRVSTLKLITG